MEKTAKKPKETVVEKQIQQDAEEENYVVSLKRVPTSPRKMRLVADLIRGKRVSSALNILKHETKHPSYKLEKLLLSAVSNWELKNPDLKLEETDLFVKQIYVNQGRILKRIRPAPQGRAHRINKRSNHVTLVIGNKEKQRNRKKKADQKQSVLEKTK